MRDDPALHALRDSLVHAIFGDVHTAADHLNIACAYGAERLYPDEVTRLAIAIQRIASVHR